MAGIEKIKIPVKKDELSIESIKPYLSDVYSKFCENQKHIRHFWNVYKNQHSIAKKTRAYSDVDSVNNKISTPHLWSMVNFKSGYALGNPKEYAQTEEKQTDDIKFLNKYAKSVNLRSLDKNVAIWVYATGVGYYFIEPKSENINPKEAQNLLVKYLTECQKIEEPIKEQLIKICENVIHKIFTTFPAESSRLPPDFSNANGHKPTG